MSNFKIQFGKDIRRKSGPADLTYDGLKDIIVNSYLKPEADFDYEFKLAYQDSDSDWVTISSTEDLQLAFTHHEGEALKVVVLGAKKIDLKAKAFKKAFDTGLHLLTKGAAEAAVPHFVEALRIKKDPTSAYNLACAFSLLNKAEESLLWLRTAHELGYENFMWALRDPDLANVREAKEEEFVAILREMRNKQVPPFFRQLACGPCGPRTQQAPAKTGSKATPRQTSAPASPARSTPLSAKSPEFVPTEEGKSEDELDSPPSPAASSSSEEPAAQFTAELAQLAAMGFVDPVSNRALLAKHAGDVVKTVHELLFA